jgi:AraC-like DNA-binding protein
MQCNPRCDGKVLHVLHYSDRSDVAQVLRQPWRPAGRGALKARHRLGRSRSKGQSRHGSRHKRHDGSQHRLTDTRQRHIGDLNTNGLLAGLRDPGLAIALHGIHTQTAHPWTLATLARSAGMSRSSFAERFARVIGTTPLNYLLQWRLAVAKNMLAREQMSVAQTAFAVGDESASGFSTAFSRETGQSPKQFADAHRGNP